MIMSEIKWKNTLNDDLPPHNQDVLISSDGIYYTATYDAVEMRFKLKYEIGKFFPVKNAVIYWKPLSPPK
jgi:hypothetical protein